MYNLNDSPTELNCNIRDNNELEKCMYGKEGQNCFKEKKTTISCTIVSI